MSKPVIAVICVVVGVLALPFLAQLTRNNEPAPPPSATNVPVVQSTPQGPPGTPVIVEMDPPNGTSNVSPGKTSLRVTFSVPMESGFSWTGGPPKFPPTPEGQNATWMPDRKTCVLPVALQPDTAYELGLNSKSFKNFRSESGVPLVPVVYRFSTGPSGS